MHTATEQAMDIRHEQQVLSVKHREIAEGYAREHLVECCKEIAAQRHTNLLAGGRMAELRSILGVEDIYVAQRLVESLAVESIAKTSAQPNG